MAFTLPSLPYAFHALEPHIDAQTMEIHYSKHHATYVSKLNEAIANTPLDTKDLEVLLREDSHLPAVRNNGGGHWNHSLFWQSLDSKGGGEPAGDLQRALTESFESFTHFKELFTQTALGRFGSGWAWLCLNEEKKLAICSTANQDNPLIPDCCKDNSRCMPLLGLDVWEHAYYLRYQNRRPDYVAAFFNIINWKFVASRYTKYL